MEFLQVPETPAPQPVEPDVPDCCGEEKIGECRRKTAYCDSKDFLVIHVLSYRGRGDSKW